MRWQWKRRSGDVPSLVGYWAAVHPTGFELRVARYPHRWTWIVRWRRPTTGENVTVASGTEASLTEARRKAEAWPEHRVGRACTLGLMEKRNT